MDTLSLREFFFKGIYILLTFERCPVHGIWDVRIIHTPNPIQSYAVKHLSLPPHSHWFQLGMFLNKETSFIDSKGQPRIERTLFQQMYSTSIYLTPHVLGAEIHSEQAQGPCFHGAYILLGVGICQYIWICNMADSEKTKKKRDAGWREQRVWHALFLLHWPGKGSLISARRVKSWMEGRSKSRGYSGKGSPGQPISSPPAGKLFWHLECMFSNCACGEHCSKYSNSRLYAAE